MAKPIFTLLGVMCLSWSQVLSQESSQPDSSLESRQGLLGSPLLNPNLLSLDPLGLGVQNPYLQYPSLYNPGLLNLGGLQGLPELQNLGGLQGLAGQGLQDPQSSLLKRTGLLGLNGGLGNTNLLLPRTLGLRQALPLGSLGGLRGQDSIGDLLRLNALLGIDGRSSNSFPFSQRQQLQPSGLSSLFPGEANNRNEDRELTELLELLSSMQSSPSTNFLGGARAPTSGLRRLSPPIQTSPFVRGGRFLPNFPIQRQGLEGGIDSVSRTGTPENDFLGFANPTENKNNRQQDLETGEEQFLFPNRG